jgi:adenosylmethionine---8-amino-7-oxononanoate aminotransferase
MEGIESVEEYAVGSQKVLAVRSDYARLIGQDQTHCWHPFTQARAGRLPLPVVSAQGAELHLADGSRMIDAIASWWVNLHGHCHPYLIEKMGDQLNRLDQVIFADFTHEPGVLLAERLVALLPNRMQRIYYSDNGSTAVETALKVALQYWHNRGEPRRRVIALKGGYHGETFGAMALSDQRFSSDLFASHLFPVEFVPPTQEGLAKLQEIVASKEVAAFFFEPHLQGVGGMISHSLEVLSEMVSSCQKAGTLTVADEVLTGCGRTGPYFASSGLTTPPDIICLAKGLTSGTVPLGVTACSEAIFEAFTGEERSKALLHGHSYCGNPLACTAALASLDLLVSGQCDQQRQVIERSHRERASQWTGRVKRVEVVGTVLAVELASGSSSHYLHPMRDRLSDHFLDWGVLIRPFGNVLHLIPPYCITAEQLTCVYEAIEESFTLYE